MIRMAVFLAAGHARPSREYQYLAGNSGLAEVGVRYFLPEHPEFLMDFQRVGQTGNHRIDLGQTIALKNLLGSLD
jgi:hypothetical protein